MILLVEHDGLGGLFLFFKALEFKMFVFSLFSRRRRGPAAVLVRLPEEDSRSGVCGGLV